MINQEQVIQLSLEEIRSIDRQMSKLKEQRAIAVETLLPMFDCPPESESHITNVGDFKVTKTDRSVYALNKKQFASLDDEKKALLMDIGVVQEDVKLSQGNLKKNLDKHQNIMVECITMKTETKLDIKEIK